MKNGLDCHTLAYSPKVIMNEHVLQQIQYLCKNIPKDEWSGIILYKVIGESNTLDFSVELVEILPLDKGTQAHTTYKFDERITAFMMANPMRMKCKIGHIHSHNTMRVFFSGEDMDELYENSELHNMYLSLVINNFMDFVCKIVFRGTFTVAEPVFVCNDMNGDPFNMKTSEIKKTGFFDMDCTIEVPRQIITVDDVFASNTKEIIRVAEERIKAQQAKPVVNAKPAANTNPLPLIPGISPGDASGWMKQLEQGFFDGSVTPQIDLTEDEIFAAYVISLGNYEEGEDVIDVLMEASTYYTVQEHADEVVNNFFALYEAFFDKVPNRDENHFVSSISKVIDELTNVPGTYMTSVYTETLNEYLTKVVKMLKDESGK